MEAQGLVAVRLPFLGGKNFLSKTSTLLQTTGKAEITFTSLRGPWGLCLGQGGNIHIVTASHKMRVTTNNPIQAIGNEDNINPNMLS